MKQNNPEAPKSGVSPALTKMRKRILWQAGLAGVTVVLTIVIVFAMTSAWYTNIVQTSGLTFQAQAWGFDGVITVNTDPIVAGPGDDGLIQLTVQNESENMTAVSVNVSKAKMADEMQKRLYFYVDTKLTRNGETMERVYLNNQESYTYTLFREGTLNLTETMHNDAQLKWEWVYDVLGYYVLGELKDDKTDVNELEYLRPIQYDYDEATTTFKKVKVGDTEVLTMELKTVDGTTTADQFLVNLSKTDGYEGTINPDKKLKSGYYPVDVDDTGYGVYAYLCSYSEIELATAFDTRLGKDAAAGKGARYEAELNIAAQKNKNNTINVTSLAGLNTAMGLDNVDVIQLSSNITISENDSLVIAKGQRVMIDLNGYSIISKSPGIAIEVEEDASLMLTNGNIQGPSESGYAIYAVGAETVLSDVDITDFKFGVYVADDESTNALDSRVRLVRCNLTTTSCAVYALGNGSASEQDTQIIIEDCNLTSDGTAIAGNGTASGSGKWGTDIQIIGSFVKGGVVASSPGVAVYQPQKDSSLTVYKSTLSGYTGIALKGGSASIVDSGVSGLGAKNAAAFYGSGCADTGDGIYIETNYGYEILLEISGNSVINSTYGDALQVYEEDAANVTVKIYSGEFSSEPPDAYIAEGSVKNKNTVYLKTG